MEKIQSEKMRNVPSLSTLLKISIGLFIVAIISSAFVYAETTSVLVDGTPYDVSYTGDGVSVTGIEADMDFVSLLVLVDVTGSSGTLNITFDRSFFDSKYDGADEDFIVLIDADEATFSETETTSTSRTLSIELPEGTEEVEIIGSSFVNEVESTTEEPEPVEEPETVEKEIPASFVDPTKDPKSYVSRYISEPSYKAWFEENFSEYTFYEALGITEAEYDQIVNELTSKSETPIPEEKPTVEEKPKTECGPGTVLQDGVCKLDERCGPGTIMEDGKCVVAPEPEETVTPKEAGKELLIGIIAAFIVAGTVGLILALMSKASKSKN